MMLKRSMKILVVLVIMWGVSLFTIVTKFNYKSSNHLVRTTDDWPYDHYLSKFKNKYEYAVDKVTRNTSESAFARWKNIGPRGTGLTLEDKLEALKGYAFPPGMEGKPVFLNNQLRTAIRVQVSSGWSNHAFNQFVSDMIPLNRTIPDPREESCLKERYMMHLPQSSVVICFHNEAWSTLLRTVHSVIMRSPGHLLKEIILFDDASTMSHLKTRLSDYIRALPKVILVQSHKRKGLIRARLSALKEVSAPVVVFLDSHCECAEGWLEPLLERIATDATIVATPVIDAIHENSFEYIPQEIEDLQIGGFSWDLRFTWRTIPRETLVQRKIPTDPIKTPTISGGLFAINKEFFRKLGYYDSGFLIWGAENLELSFKTWMCGGSMEIVPCSHVGHVFRKRFPYLGQKGSFRRNCLRLAKVWLDEYAKYFYDRIGYDEIDYGNVTARIELRKELNCKSFDWYMKNIYRTYDLPDNFAGSGNIIHIKNSDKHALMCLDAALPQADFQTAVKLTPCHFLGGNQYWVYTKNGEIKRDTMCLDYVMNVVTFFVCHGRALSQVWLYDKKSQSIRNMANQKCLRTTISSRETKLILEGCSGILAEKWSIEHFEIEKLSPNLQIEAKKLL